MSRSRNTDLDIHEAGHVHDMQVKEEMTGRLHLVVVQPPERRDGGR